MQSTQTEMKVGNGKMSLFKEYVLNTTFHGYRFLGEEDKHWTERLFWTVVCILSCIAAGMLMQANWNNFQHNAISFVVDTSYLEWNTSFPSIAVCEIDNEERIASITDRMFGDPHDYNLDEIVRELAFFKGYAYYTVQYCGQNVEPSPYCYITNISAYQSMVRSTCEDIFVECKWNNKSFDCCKFFSIMDTELGICYAINSLQTRESNVPRLPMISNKKTGPGFLHLEMRAALNIYMFGEQEVPSLTTLPNNVLQVLPYVHYNRYIKITETENEAEVRDCSIEQRMCRFPDENYLEVHKYYSYSACNIQCRKNAHLEKCNCTHHLMPNTNASKTCNTIGLECLQNNYNDLAVLKAAWALRRGLVCECLPSCTETEIAVTRENKFSYENPHAVVDLCLESLPTERFKRNVIHGKLDLVVSLGGTAALFLGASLLSVIEIIYFFFIRAPNTRKIKN